MNPDRIHKNSSRLKSFGYALKGIFSLFKEPNARIMLSIAILVIIAAFILKLTGIEWCLILLCIGAVFTAEAFNSSIERFTDLACPSIDPKAGLIKDLAAGAVLLSCLVSAIVGLIIFLSKII